MARFFLTIEYNGADYVGWQRQNSGLSVQQLIEEAVKSFSGLETPIFGAGRTDSGVHAIGQVAHLDLPDKFESYKIMLAINAYLRKTKIKVICATKVIPEAHARFSAIWREYKYTILNRISPPALNEGIVYHQKNKLNIKLMSKASQVLIGTHDFTSFRSTNCQSQSPVKTIDNISIEKNDNEIVFTIRAKSFLHHQVRNIVGSLQLVGLNKWNEENLLDVLNKKDRKTAGPTAPACGLVFNYVKYPDEIFLEENYKNL